MNTLGVDEKEYLHAIPEVEALLAEPLDVENSAALEQQLARAEAWLGRVSFQHRNAERLLSQIKKTMLLPKSKDYTDMDRTINLESSVRDQQCLVDMLGDQAEYLGRRISLGQSLKRSHTEEIKRQIR